MALVVCEECGREVSDKAPQCPTCGAPGLSGRSAISARSVVATGLALAGAGLFLLGRDPTLTISGGILLVVGLLGALL